MRQYYETTKDLLNEKTVMSYFLAHCDTYRDAADGFEKLPISYGVDYCIVRGSRIVAWAEVKCRPGLAWNGKHDTLILSLLKWESAFKHMHATGKTFLLVVRFAGGEVGYCKLTLSTTLPVVEYGGRTHDTRDDGDIEPVVHIPLDWFNIVGILPDEEMHT